LALLEETFAMSPDLKEKAPKDSDLEALHDDARLKALIAG
jgi:hypothetical protein